MLDFSENYSFVLQDEVQAFHWNKSQGTIYTIAYYRQMEENKLKNFIVISECLTCNRTAVYTFQKKLIIFPKENDSPFPGKDTLFFLVSQEYSIKIGKNS